MKVLKQGLKPTERWYKGTCYSCGTEVEFQRKEAELVSDQRDGDYVKVKCPTCNGSITVQASKWSARAYSTPVDCSTIY